VSVSDLRCDRCSVVLSGPAGTGSGASTSGSRLTYHPGDLELRDDSGLLCAACWADLVGWLKDPGIGTCSVCRQTVSRYGSLHVRRADSAGGWQLCPPHAADLLNSLRTVQPKFDRGTFRLPLDRDDRAAADGDA
jgi:hypothetical protein